MDMRHNTLKKFIKRWTEDSNLSFLVSILKKYPRAKAYLVGGMVRDLAMGKPSTDYDIVISGVPLGVLRNVLKKPGKVNLVGKTFGVLKFRPPHIPPLMRGGKKEVPPLTKGGQGGVEIDIALPRTEHAFKTGGYRDVNVQSNYRLPIEKDLERRDFTINAMAVELAPATSFIPGQRPPLIPPLSKGGMGGVIDPFGGLKDLKKKIIRAVGDPSERFREDYSRMLRALRFSVQLGFEIEKKTWQAMVRMAKNINKKISSLSPHPTLSPVGRGARHSSTLSPLGRGAGGEGEYIVPREIIAKELVKMFSYNPVKSLEILDKSGILALLMPELLKMKKCPQPRKFHAEGDVWKHTMLALNFSNSKKFKREFSNNIQNSKFKIPLEVVWALLFHDLGKPYTIKYAERIRFDGHDAKSAELWRKISERLKLSSAGIDVEKTEKLISKHMFLTNAKLDSVKETTLEKYFFSELFPGRELLMLMFADVSATIPPSGRPDFGNYRRLKTRLKNLEKKILTHQKKKVKDILDGYEIMKILKLKPGKKVGEIKKLLREMQLRGKIKTKGEVKKYIRKVYAPSPSK